MFYRIIIYNIKYSKFILESSQSGPPLPSSITQFEISIIRHLDNFAIVQFENFTCASQRAVSAVATAAVLRIPALQSWALAFFGYIT